MRKLLPDRYYLDHFKEFLTFFDGVNKTLLDSHSTLFIERFKALSEDEQCVIVRAATRKYSVVVKKTFDYSEIEQSQEVFEQLVVAGWFGNPINTDCRALCQVATKTDLLDLLSENGLHIPKHTPKAQINSLVIDSCQNTALKQLHSIEGRYYYRNFEPVLAYLLFLYFGHLKGRLNQFSMRDLGIMRTRKDASAVYSRFENREAALAAFYYAQQLAQFKLLNEKQRQCFVLDPRERHLCRVGSEYKDQLLYQMALYWLPIDSAKALELLNQATSDQACEKWIRESFKLGHKGTVKARLSSLIDSPPSEHLLAFAEDFYARKFNKKRTSTLTDMLRSASKVMEIDEVYAQDAEQGVIEAYRRQGLVALKTENTLFRTIFGLLFWDWLYGERGLANEFDRRPQVLQQNSFYTAFEIEINQQLQRYCGDSEAFKRFLLKQASEHFGKVNSLFVWHQGLLAPISLLLDTAPLAAIRAFLLNMCKDYASFNDGYPDIMVIAEDKLWFEEIKAPGDQLRRNQLVTIQRLQQCGFSVSITQVRWVQDPMQPYVVVDIETTGGGATHHRITEIGMVKLVDGVEVARWHSLINPQRSIPSKITQLTGIHNAMVKSAPTFAVVAEEVEAFISDSVFVAHNVNFDYGFIKHEFERLGEAFKHPKICTCARMRQCHPGLQSYSLGALTKHFSIPLDNHHRALDDALAAAQLLRIIQAN